MTACDDKDLELVYKVTAKRVPDRMIEYFLDHPDEARDKLEILCRKHQMVKKFEFKEFQRDNR
jgi:hypothetical protein